MSDNKEYVSHLQSNGTVHISQEVIASVAGRAATEVDGVCGLHGNPGLSISELIAKKSLSKGVRVAVNEKNQVAVHCYIIVYLGHGIVDIAKNVQEAVRETVSSVTGLKVVSVSVTVTGVAMPAKN